MNKKKLAIIIGVAVVIVAVVVIAVLCGTGVLSGSTLGSTAPAVGTLVE